jgi:hypothetical protein
MAKKSQENSKKLKTYKGFLAIQEQIMKNSRPKLWRQA